MLTQESIIKELAEKVKQLNIKLDTAESTCEAYKSQSVKLEYEVERLRTQLDFEQRECKTRHQNLDKLKGKNRKLKERVIEL